MSLTMKRMKEINELLRQYIGQHKEEGVGESLVYYGVFPDDPGRNEVLALIAEEIGISSEEIDEYVKREYGKYD